MRICGMIARSCIAFGTSRPHLYSEYSIRHPSVSIRLCCAMQGTGTTIDSPQARQSCPLGSAEMVHHDKEGRWCVYAWMGLAASSVTILTR